MSKCYRRGGTNICRCDQGRRGEMGKEGEEAEEVGVLIAVEAVGSRAALRDADELWVTLLVQM